MDNNLQSLEASSAIGVGGNDESVDLQKKGDGFQAVVVFSVLSGANSVSKSKTVFGALRYSHGEHLASHEKIRKSAFGPEFGQHTENTKM